MIMTYFLFYDLQHKEPAELFDYIFKRVNKDKDVSDTLCYL